MNVGVGIYGLIVALLLITNSTQGVTQCAGY